MNNNVNKEAILVYGEDTIPFLQHIVDVLSDNQIKSDRYLTDFSKLKKIKISIKKTSGAPRVKSKIKYEEKDNIVIDPIKQRTPDREIPDYDVLKKRLEKIYKIIDDRLSNGSFPSNIEIELFYTNAEMMSAYSVYGDKMLPVYLQLISKFREAFHQVDFQKCQAAFSAIKALKWPAILKADQI